MVQRFDEIGDKTASSGPPSTASAEATSARPAKPAEAAEFLGIAGGGRHVVTVVEQRGHQP